MMKRMIPLVMLLLAPGYQEARPAGDPAALESIRSRLAQAGEEAIEHDDTMGPGWERYEILMRGLKREPTDRLLESIDVALREGTIPEKIGAVGLYSDLRDLKRVPARDPTYAKRLLNLLSKDDFSVRAYTGYLTGQLLSYPSRETMLGLMEAAGRTTDREMRDRIVHHAATLVEMEEVVSPQPGSPPTPEGVAKFTEWFGKHKDQIQFTREGRFKLGKGKPAEERPELTVADRAAIRENAVCVLHLVQFTLGDPSGGPEANAKARELNARCGPALFGAERSGVMGKLAEAGEGERGPSPGMELQLRGAADYPTPDAELLAAVYVVSYEQDPEALRLARETLVRASRDEIRRVCKGEPSSVCKKAESLAGT